MQKHFITVLRHDDHAIALGAHHMVFRVRHSDARLDLHRLTRFLVAYQRVAPLTMGWCVECHRAANAGQLPQLAWLPEPKPVLKKQNVKAPLECVNCHH